VALKGGRNMKIGNVKEIEIYICIVF